jgi:hypothetical protein
MSQTAIELQPVGESSYEQVPIKEHQDPVEFLPQPSTTVSVVERWNNPKINIWRTAATFYASVIMGANDAAYGALIPYVSCVPKVPYDNKS